MQEVILGEVILSHICLKRLQTHPHLRPERTVKIQFFYLRILYCPYAKNLFAFISFPIQCLQILSCIPNLSLLSPPTTVFTSHTSLCTQKLGKTLRFWVQE